MRSTIREATERDVSRLVEMGMRFNANSIYATIFPTTPARMRELVELLIAEHIVWVAELRSPGLLESNPMRPPMIGMLAMAIVPHMLLGCFYGEEVAWWVEPEHRKSTAGPRLMHKMECHCMQKRLHMVKMLAPADSTVGAFYRKCGYQEIETAWIKVLTPYGTDELADVRRQEP